MPIRYRVSENGGFVHAFATGVLTPFGVSRYERQTEEDDRVLIGFLELLDVTGMTDSEIEPHELHGVRETIRANPKKDGKSVLAIVSAGGPTFQRARYIEKLVTPVYRNVTVFKDSDAAKRWLGVDGNGAGSL